MSSRKLTSKEIKQQAIDLGADLVGIAPISRWDHAPVMLRPQDHLPEAKSVIVMGIHHPDASVEWGGLPNSNFAGPFQIGMIPKLDTMSQRMSKYLENNGETAIPFPCTGYWRHRPYKNIESTNTASFSHRHAAVAAGLGEFGWNNLLLTPKYGPRQRVISVVTTADLEPDPLYNGTSLCDNCKMCAKHCPGNNFDKNLVLSPGSDKVVIENKTYTYAKLNRWRCLWGEQFALDMGQLKSYGITGEDDLYKAVKDGIPRLGGEFGSCLRYCMSKPVRYWDRKYTSAPRRKKVRKEIVPSTMATRIRDLARLNGADRLVIMPLREALRGPDSKRSERGIFAEPFATKAGLAKKGQLEDKDWDMAPEDYPISGMKKNFSWLIAFGRKIPSYPEGHALLADCEEYIRATTKVRMSIAAYDIAAYLDELGYEAMQDWMSLSGIVMKSGAWNDIKNDDAVYKFDSNETRPWSREERYKAAARRETGVQREQQSMTAGAENVDRLARDCQSIISCAVICNAPLQAVSEPLDNKEDLPLEDFRRLKCLKNVSQIGVVAVDCLAGLPGIVDFKKALPGARSLVVLLDAIPKRVVELADKQKAECGMSYSFLQYQVLRELLWTAHDLGDWLGSKGHPSVPLADCSLRSYRTIAPYWEFAWSKLGHPDRRANAPLAAAAGLGEIGWSGLLLNPEFGPRHQVVFLATTAELTESPEYTGKNICAKCGACIDACPVQALNKNVDRDQGRAGVGAERNEEKCQWARSLGMVAEEGPGSIGWRKPALPVPDKIDNVNAQQALDQKDPLQVIGYRYPCQVDTIIERCLQACPAGKKR